ncbi:hypothetical protein B0T17DRAFT_358162 [Bombardia bombarda]|uniref:Uncharacterized protein n=1 Tax=Bombardia bombarda TaxID=252184 RepID=A0AA40BW73_9PEZI|nr:hypothetical protein B0T17DRAFT_358162 [Bombardia bombarda]
MTCTGDQKNKRKAPQLPPQPQAQSQAQTQPPPPPPPPTTTTTTTTMPSGSNTSSAAPKAADTPATTTTAATTTTPSSTSKPSKVFVGTTILPLPDDANPICGNCNLVGHLASHCLGPWDPMTGTLRVCVFCNTKAHLSDNCPAFWNTYTPSKRYSLFEFLVVYRAGKAPVDTRICWPQLAMDYRNHGARQLDRFPMTRAFAVRTYAETPWKGWDYGTGKMEDFPCDELTRGYKMVRANLSWLCAGEKSLGQWRRRILVGERRAERAFIRDEEENLKLIEACGIEI